jgi:hypothetical protein
MGREERPKTVRRTRFRLDIEKRRAARATKVADRKRLRMETGRKERPTRKEHDSPIGRRCIYICTVYPPRVPLLSVRWPVTSDQRSLFATRRDTIRDGLIKPENANPITIAASDGRLRHRAYSHVERHVSPVVTHLRCKQAGCERMSEAGHMKRA